MTLNSNFIGIGLGVSPVKAIRLCKERTEIYRNLAVLNIGFSSSTSISDEDIELINNSSFTNVLHLEEFNISDDFDHFRFERFLNTSKKIDKLWLEQDLGVWHQDGMNLGTHMLNPVLSNESLEITINNLKDIMRLSDSLFLAENPPIYLNIENLDLLTYMSLLAEESSCGLVLDIGHLIGYCVATSRDPFAYLKDWDGIGYVREIHIAGFETFYKNGKTYWLDKHSLPIPEYALSILQEVCKNARNALIVTLEQDGASPEVEKKNIESVFLSLGLPI